MSRLSLMFVGGTAYSQKVRKYSPIAYWPMWEPSGSIANCLVNPAQNGAYTGVTLGQPGIGDGRTAPLFDGANDSNNVYSASLAGIFDGGEGTVHLWCRVSGAGVWTDGAIRYAALFGVDLVGNFLGIRRTAVNNTLQWLYLANGTAESVSLAGITTLDWFPVALTWSASTGGTGEVRAYINGAQTGVTQVGLGVWAGALAAIRAAIGSVNGPTPMNVWDGYLAHAAIWDRPLTPTEIAELAVV